MSLAKEMCITPTLWSHALHVHNQLLHLFLLGNGLHIDSQRKIEVSFMREKMVLYMLFLGRQRHGRGYRADVREANGGDCRFKKKKPLRHIV